MIRRLRWLVLFLPTCLPTSVLADFVAYSNVDNFSGFGLANGGATNQPTSPLTTTMVVDDITPISTAVGHDVVGFQFSVVNFSTTAVSARPLVRFYAADGVDGGPGTFLGGVTVDPFVVRAASATLKTFSSSTPLFTMPSAFWAGIVFDNGGTSTAVTAALLNNFGQAVFDPPTIGSSADVYFQTTGTGQFINSNPVGDFKSFNGSPIASFGWSFTVAGSPVPTPVPEPGSATLAMTGCALLAVGFARDGWWKRRRERIARG